MEKRKHWTKDLLVRVLPIWQGQIELGCELTEQAIESLTRKFLTVVGKLEDEGKDWSMGERDNQAKQNEMKHSMLLLKQLIEQGKHEECLERIQGLEKDMACLVGGYEKQIESIQQSNCEIKSQVEDILVDLQFQDRVSQILRTVTKTQIQLYDVVSDSREKRECEGKETVEFDTEKWIEGMREDYVMEDQCKIHDGNVKVESKQVDEITFF